MYMYTVHVSTQAENAALTRDKKTLESQLEVQRSKIKQLESTLAKREAEVYIMYMYMVRVYIYMYVCHLPYIYM